MASMALTTPSRRFPGPGLKAPKAPPRVVVLVRAKMPEPGMYGGPPDRKVRQSWGGGARTDPLEGGEYLWDTKEEWQRQLDQQSAGPSNSTSPTATGSAADAETSGFLSLGRAFALDSMEVDLSRELMPSRTVTLEDQVEAARIAAGERLSGRPANAPAEVVPDGSVRWRSVSAPSARATRQQEKSRSYIGQGSYFKESTPITAAEQEEQFQQLKSSLLLYTFGLGAAFSASAAFVYSPEVAASFALGALSSLVYVRMLSTSVEAFGRSGLGNAARGSLGQPRLLVPVVLVMTYNRWNSVFAPEYGLLELQLIPMLLGFLTYKAATIVQTFQELLPSPDSTSAPEKDK